MSAAELIARYGFHGMTAQWAEQDVAVALDWIANAAASRICAVEQSSAADAYKANANFCMAIARSYGHMVRDLVDTRVALIEDEAFLANEHQALGFYYGPCADETCDGCEDALWHHMVMNERLLCPTSREWRIALRVLYRTFAGCEPTQENGWIKKHFARK